MRFHHRTAIYRGQTATGRRRLISRQQYSLERTVLMATALSALILFASKPLIAQVVTRLTPPASDAQMETAQDSVLQRLQRAEARLAELESLEAQFAEQHLGATEDKPKANEPEAKVSYGKDGFEFETGDEKFSLAIQSRIQFRYATPFDSDPRLLSDLDRDESSFMIRRARTKMRGHAYYPWLEYYIQYDWSDPVLRDMNLTIAKYKWASLEIGRGKVVYNDERKTSSGKQQFVNRSIVNDIFTVDRQQGVQLFGNLFPETWHDVTYYLGVFTGLGVGERDNDDDNLMYNARLQWNALGGEMPFSQSDIEFHEQPALGFAIAANTNRSGCLAYATSDESCRPLPWAPYDTLGAPGQYRINQMLAEVRFKWQGFSLLHEMHVKQIIDTLAAQDSLFRETTMLGGFVQAGYFPYYAIPVVPQNLEIAGRYAVVDPNLAENNIEQQEASAVMNYFFSGHENKVSLQVSHLTLDPDNARSDSEQRFWLQWDISF